MYSLAGYGQSQLEDMMDEEAVDDDDDLDADDEEEFLDKTKLLEKSSVKGMLIVPMNTLSRADFIQITIDTLEKKNIVSSRAMDLDRRDREHYFLRWKLARRLEQMDNGNEEDHDECRTVDDRMDPSFDHQSFFDSYRKQSTSS